MEGNWQQEVAEGRRSALNSKGMGRSQGRAVAEGRLREVFAVQQVGDVK
jgi:hypothetical protein